MCVCVNEINKSIASLFLIIPLTLDFCCIELFRPSEKYLRMKIRNPKLEPHLHSVPLKSIFHSTARTVLSKCEYITLFKILWWLSHTSLCSFLGALRTRHKSSYWPPSPSMSWAFPAPPAPLCPALSGLFSVPYMGCTFSCHSAFAYTASST